MDALRGFVYRIIYQNTQNTYCVFLVKDYNEEYITCTGRFEAPNEGEDVELKGRYVEHQKYGFQFDASSIEKLKPDNMGSARLYLMNLGIKGLGEKSIDKICDYFGIRLLDVLREERPEEIKDVPGLRKGVKEELYNTLLGEGILSDLNHFFESHQISSKWSRTVYTYYGASSIDVIRDNPYNLLRIAPDMLFNTADTLAVNLGIEADDERRLEAGVNWILGNLDNQGHTCLPVDELIGRTYDLLQVDADLIANHIDSLISQGIVYSTYYDDILYVYPPEMYVSEVEGVHYTRDFLIEADPISLDIPSFIERFEAENHITFGPEQKEAIELSFFEKFSLITGGPGTGKTTIIKALVKGFQLGGLGRIILCAPTGRAAKRLTEATEFEATTIHRLLMPVAGSDSYDFTKNEDDPLDIDVIIIDEASMLNVRLFYSLMSAIPREAHVIIVGDVDQLPPIGAGFVLKDLLDSDMVPYTRLQHIYRQSSGNSIVDSAYAINRGEMPSLDITSDEFTFIPVNSLGDMMKGNVSYATSWVAAVAIILLDYVGAFTVLGLVGIFKKNKNQTPVLVIGAAVVCVLRYICHVITGCTVWAGVSIPTADGMAYSLVYNAAYMIPETVVTVYVIALISNAVDLRVEKPVTKKKSENVMAILNGALVFGIAVLIDFLYLFQQIQTEEGFDITLIVNSNWGLVAIITVVGVVVGAIVYFGTKIVSRKKAVA